MTPSDNTEFLFRCDICNMLTKEEAELLEHKTMRHPDNTVEPYYWVCHPDREIYKDDESHITRGECTEHQIADGSSIPAHLIHSLTTQARIDEWEKSSEAALLAAMDMGKFAEHKQRRIAELKGQL